MNDLVRDLLEGSPRALARLLTRIENENAEAAAALAALYPHTGRAHRIGVTGAPGTGKSTLVNSMAKAYRAEGRTVGIIAVDPTSPFSGGAVLGDRIRMRDLAGDPGVFIRSMATRGSLGGLARATGDAVRALDAAGFDVILIETVGAGQSEVDIAREAHTTIVVEAPGLGDEIQAIKAGILEIADILVVNKADRPGAKNTVRALKAMLDLGGGHPPHIAHHGRLLTDSTAPPETDQQENGWQIPIIQTIAIEDSGIAELLAAVDAHRTHLQETGQWQQREQWRLESELLDRLQTTLLKRLLKQTDPSVLRAIMEQLTTRQIDPHTAVERLLDGHPDTDDDV